MEKVLIVAIVAGRAARIVETDRIIRTDNGGSVVHIDRGSGTADNLGRIVGKPVVADRHPVFGFEREVNVRHQQKLLILSIGRNFHIVAGFRFTEFAQDRIVVEGLTRIDKVAEFLQLDTVGNLNRMLVEDTDHQLHHLEGVAVDKGTDAGTIRCRCIQRAAVNGVVISHHPFPLHAVAATERVGIVVHRQTIGTYIVRKQHRLGGGDAGILILQVSQTRIHAVGKGPITAI